MVPNLPSPLVIPTAGTPAAPDVDGASLDFFARLLGSGPLAAAIAGQAAPPADVIALRAAPADRDAEPVEEAPSDGSLSPDIIPLVQAQSGFPVVVVPSPPVATPPAIATAMPSPPIVSTPRPAAASIPIAKPSVETEAANAAPAEAAETADAAVPASVLPAAESTHPARGKQPIKRAVQPVPCQPAELERAAEGDAAVTAETVAPAVKALVGKLRNPPPAQAERGMDRAAATPAEAAHVQPAAAQAAQRRPEPVAARVDGAVQPIATILTSSAAPAFAPVAVVPQPVATASLTPDAMPNVADLVVERQLDLANDGQWLDRLARDIARAGATDEPLRFRLHPQTLGHLQVELAQSDRGATVRLTVETEAARNILVDAQPRLAAEARAQGVRLAGTEVDLGTAGQQSDARRNAEARPQDIVRVVRSTRSDSASSAPAPSRSDRYA